MRIELWAGLECSVVRIGDRFVDEVELTGHASRQDDVERLARIGFAAVRYPVLWERVSPDPQRDPDWAACDQRLERLRELGVRPIVGLVHHGSGPRGTSLLEDSFVDGLADFARRVARRYPWITDYTPVNEPLTTARFSGLYGHWYPHARGDEPFVRALMVQCRAIRAAMRAIREVQPAARLVQTEDLGTIFSTHALAYQARFENLRRFASLDILTGTLTRRHGLWPYLEEHGACEALESFLEEPCVPDIVGLNHYVTSDRFLDERLDRYPPRLHGGNGRHAYADVEAVRVRGAGLTGHRALLELVWERYHLPVAITESHLGCRPEEQIRWLYEAWTGAKNALESGVDVRAVTAWSAFGAAEWDSLLTSVRGHYEPGLFDVRGGRVRSTALAQVCSELTQHGISRHPLLGEPGWWRRRERLVYPSFGRPICAMPSNMRRPVLVLGAGGTLGDAVVRAATARGMAVVALARARLDITERARVTGALEAYRPWAVVNAAGYVYVDEAEADVDTCMRTNADAAAALAAECHLREIRLVTFSSDLVFDGSKTAPYLESDAPAPLATYGESKARAERLVSAAHPDAIIVRTSAFFGPRDEANFVVRALSDLRAGRLHHAAADVVVSPTYVPDLADACLTLLVDGASALWHLANPGALSWYELAVSAARLARLPPDLVVPCAQAELRWMAKRPSYSALESERGALLRPLEAALEAFVARRGGMNEHCEPPFRAADVACTG